MNSAQCRAPFIERLRRVEKNQPQGYHQCLEKHEWRESPRTRRSGTILPAIPHRAAHWVASAWLMKRQYRGGISVSARGVLPSYLGGMVVLVTASFALPALHLVLWTAIGLSSVAAILVGVRLHRPRRRAPWFLLAAAVG